MDTCVAWPRRAAHRGRITDQIARFVRETAFEDLPGPVVAKTEVCLLDWFMVTILGSRERPAEIMEKALLGTSAADRQKQQT